MLKTVALIKIGNAGTDDYQSIFLTILSGIVLRKDSGRAAQYL
jgi:hypothetical protein